VPFNSPLISKICGKTQHKHLNGEKSPMKILSFIFLIFFSLPASCQLWHKADSLLHDYFKTLRKKKPISQLIIQKGVYVNSAKEKKSSMRDVDSLLVISISLIDGAYEIAVFDDNSLPTLKKVDSCEIFRQIKESENDLSEKIQYMKSLKKIRGLDTIQSRIVSSFETIVITKKKKTAYFCFIGDRHFDSKGRDIDTQKFYLATRRILDSAYAISKVEYIQ
jgi:hypothetical protein